MKEQPIRIIGISGSTRNGSYNTAALMAAGELLPEGATLEILEISALPFFQQDLEARGLPPEVAAFKARLAAADAVLIATPEYNYAMPPLLKNAIDWASRGESAVYGKPLAILSASPSLLGGARAQYQLRQTCVSVNLLPINKPEVMIGLADQKFDGEGHLVDSVARDFIGKLVGELVRTAAARRKN